MNTTTETVPKDFLGQPLRVGDTVVLVQSCYRVLEKGTVIKVHPAHVTITTDDGYRTLRNSLNVVRGPREEASNDC